MSFAVDTSLLPADAEAVERLRDVVPPHPELKALDGERRGPFRPQTLAPARVRLSGLMLKRVFQTVDGWVIAALAALFASDGSALLARSVAEVLPFAVGSLLSIWNLRWLHAYRFTAREAVWTHLAKLAAAFLLTAAIVAPLSLVFAPAHLILATGWTLATFAAVGVAHLWARLNVRRWRQQGRLTPNVVFVGATKNAGRMIEAALKTQEVAVLGIFDDRIGRVPAAIKGVPVLGDTEALLQHKIIPYVDRIVITVTAASQPRVRQLISRLRLLPNAVTLFLDVHGEDARAATLSKLADLPLAQVSGAADDERRAFAKRIQDMVLGGILFVVALPIMALIALAIRLDSPGPILFCQRRYGFNNETITVCKFRSMRHEHTDRDASRQVQLDDERITRVGRFIRSTSLDELPQLWNVLKGEMSLVGPRPHAVGMRTAGEESAKLVAEYAWRHRMKPGITGWAQINGSRGPVHTKEDVQRRVKLDVEYIERQSLWFDLYILAMTLPRLLGDKHTVR